MSLGESLFDRMRTKKHHGSPDSEAPEYIKKHIEETRIRQKYLVKLSRALMQYGAPTHRLEQHMSMCAKVLSVKAQFLYMPGCMIMSFDDPKSHAADVRLVKAAAGVDLGKLRDVHQVYKDVGHDVIGVGAAAEKLDAIESKESRFNKFWLVLAHGLASLAVGPFAFMARPVDLAPAFVLGCGMGLLKVWWVPKTELYSCVFEVSATILLSFASRGLGSIHTTGTLQDGEGHLFCFSALAQSSIALILPGYSVCENCP